jgi:hypothetical protein
MEIFNATMAAASPPSRSSEYGFIYTSLIAIIALAILNYTVRFVKYRQEFKKMVRLFTKVGID